jgi:hypothetical protein
MLSDNASIAFVGSTGHLTFFEGWHGKYTRKHALVVTIENTTNASKGSNPKDGEVRDQGTSTTGSHESLSTVQGRIVDGSSFYCSAHVEIVGLLTRSLGDGLGGAQMASCGNRKTAELQPAAYRQVCDKVALLYGPIAINPVTISPT